MGDFLLLIRAERAETEQNGVRRQSSNQTAFLRLFRAGNRAISRERAREGKSPAKSVKKNRQRL